MGQLTRDIFRAIKFFISDATSGERHGRGDAGSGLCTRQKRRGRGVCTRQGKSGCMAVMKVGLNQPMMREVLEKLMSSAESDVLTESVSEDSANEHQIMRKLPVRRAKKGPKSLMGRTGSKIVSQKVVKSKENAVVASLAKVARPSESGVGWGRERKLNTFYAIGRFNLNDHELEEKCTDLGGYKA